MARRRGRLGGAEPAVRGGRNRQGRRGDPFALRRHGRRVARNDRRGRAGGRPVGDVRGGGVGSASPGTASLARVRSLSPDGPGLSPTPPATNRPAARATPPVRRLAKGLGVDLATIAGTGPDGRITEDDVRAAGQGSAHGTASRSRRVIATNLERQASIPQVTTFRTVDCSALQSFRAEIGLSPLPIVVAAVARTATLHPLLTAAWGGEEPVMRSSVDVGLAVDSDRGLVVPVLHAAETKGLRAIAEGIRGLADGARAGALAPGALDRSHDRREQHGFLRLGGRHADPVAGHLRDARVRRDPGPGARRGRRRGARPAATISLTFDHRVLDGAAAGRALTDLVALLQSPERLGELPR